jgi:DNA-binding response OmpR family regulator
LCQTLVTVMRLNGYVADAVQTPGDAIDRVARFGPELIILDQRLGDTSGLAWLRELRWRRPGSRPPVILFSADMSLERHVAEIRQLGAVLCSKLCTPEELDALVASLCRPPAPSAAT